VPEFIQHLDPEALARTWQAVAEDPSQPPSLAEVRRALAGAGAVDRAADRVVAALGR